MSALGQKQTFALQKAMSALPPIATLIAFFGMIHTLRLMLGGRTIFTLLFFLFRRGTYR